jgi:hypothetical protein
MLFAPVGEMLQRKHKFIIKEVMTKFFCWGLESVVLELYVAVPSQHFDVCRLCKCVARWCLGAASQKRLRNTVMNGMETVQSYKNDMKSEN